MSIESSFMDDQADIAHLAELKGKNKKFGDIKTQFWMLKS